MQLNVDFLALYIINVNKRIYALSHQQSKDQDLLVTDHSLFLQENFIEDNSNKYAYRIEGSKKYHYIPILRGTRPIGSLVYSGGNEDVFEFLTILSGLMSYSVYQWLKSEARALYKTKNKEEYHYKKNVKYRPKSIIGNSKPIFFKCR